MRTIHAVATALSVAAAALAGLIMVGMTLLIVAEITMRTVFTRSTFVTEEYVGYGLAAFTFLGLAYSLHHGALLRLSLAIDYLPRRARERFIIAGMILTLGVSVCLTYAFWISAAQKFRGGTISATFSQTPLWIPEAFVLLGLVVFVLQLIVEIWVLIARADPSLVAEEPAENLNV